MSRVSNLELAHEDVIGVAQNSIIKYTFTFKCNKDVQTSLYITYSFNIQSHFPFEINQKVFLFQS